MLEPCFDPTRTSIVCSCRKSQISELDLQLLQKPSCRLQRHERIEWIR